MDYQTDYKKKKKLVTGDWNQSKTTNCVYQAQPFISVYNNSQSVKVMKMLFNHIYE